jgi:hypothetical protein
MYRSLAVAVLTLATADIAAAQSIYVAPGAVANIYITPGPTNGVPPAVYGPTDYGVQAPPAAYPTATYGASVYVEPGYAPYGAPGYAPQPYSGPISAYAAQPPLRGPAYIPRRHIIVEDIPRPPAPVPYGWRAR